MLVFDFGLASWLWITAPGQWPVGVTLVVIPILLLVTAPIFVWAARTETRFDLAGLLATGLLLRFAASFYRFHGATDARVYHNVGSNLAASFRHLDFAVDVKGKFPGTGGMNVVAGVAEVVTNANEFATFLLFAWLSFIGCFLLYRAFVTALPDADHRRYALLIFLWPTMLYWPSSLGKDCWMVFALGIGALGTRRASWSDCPGATRCSSSLRCSAAWCGRTWSCCWWSRSGSRSSSVVNRVVEERSPRRRSGRSRASSCCS